MLCVYETGGTERGEKCKAQKFTSADVEIISQRIQIELTWVCKFFKTVHGDSYYIKYVLQLNM